MRQRIDTSLYCRGFFVMAFIFECVSGQILTEPSRQINLKYLAYPISIACERTRLGFQSIGAA